MANWKKELKNQLLTMAAGYLTQAIFQHMPDNINVDLKPVKNFITGQGNRPHVNEMVRVTGGISRIKRKQVMEFEDPRYNYPQY